MLLILNAAVFVLVFVLVLLISRHWQFLKKREGARPVSMWKRCLLGLAAALVAFTGASAAEAALLTYPTLLAAYQATHFGEAAAVVEGSRSALVACETNGSTTSLSLVPKAGDGWKISRGTEIQPLANRLAGDPSALVVSMKHRGSTDCYLMVYSVGPENRKIQIEDSRGSAFLETQRTTPNGPVYFYYGYVGEMDEGYTLTVNGETLPLEDLH